MIRISATGLSRLYGARALAPVYQACEFDGHASHGQKAKGFHGIPGKGLPSFTTLSPIIAHVQRDFYIALPRRPAGVVELPSLAGAAWTVSGLCGSVSWNIAGKPVACSLGLFCLNSGLLWRVVAYHSPPCFACSEFFGSYTKGA